MEDIRRWFWSLGSPGCFNSRFQVIYIVFGISHLLILATTHRVSVSGSHLQIHQILEPDLLYNPLEAAFFQVVSVSLFFYTFTFHLTWIKMLRYKIQFTPASLALIFCGLHSMYRVSMTVCWTNDKSSILQNCVGSNIIIQHFHVWIKFSLLYSASLTKVISIQSHIHLNQS